MSHIIQERKTSEQHFIVWLKKIEAGVFHKFLTHTAEELIQCGDAEKDMVDLCRHTFTISNAFITIDYVIGVRMPEDVKERPFPYANASIRMRKEEVPGKAINYSTFAVYPIDNIEGEIKPLPAFDDIDGCKFCFDSYGIYPVYLHFEERTEKNLVEIGLDVLKEREGSFMPIIECFKYDKEVMACRDSDLYAGNNPPKTVEELTCGYLPSPPESENYPFWGKWLYRIPFDWHPTDEKRKLILKKADKETEDKILTEMTKKIYQWVEESRLSDNIKKGKLKEELKKKVIFDYSAAEFHAENYRSGKIGS